MAGHEHNERCKELRDALSDSRSRQLPPNRESAFVGMQRTDVMDPGNLDPDASPELQEQIRQLEQLLRDEGCEPR